MLTDHLLGVRTYAGSYILTTFFTIQKSYYFRAPELSFSDMT